MLSGLTIGPANPLGRRAPVWITSVGGVIVVNPLAYRGVPLYILLVTTGIAFKSVCKEPPGTNVYNLVQDASGSRTITTWPAWWRWIGGTAPTLTTTANKIDAVTTESDGVVTIATASLSA